MSFAVCVPMIFLYASHKSRLSSSVVHPALVHTRVLATQSLRDVMAKSVPELTVCNDGKCTPAPLLHAHPTSGHAFGAPSAFGPALGRYPSGLCRFYQRAVKLDG